MLSRIIGAVKKLWAGMKKAARQMFKRPTQPATAGVVTGTLSDLPRSRGELVAENAFLRQQLAVLHRQVKTPRLSWRERLSLLWLATWVPRWKQVLQIVQPDTLLRWHRDGFRWYWRTKSRGQSAQQPKRLAADTIALIKQMARENRQWGAERIRGELLKLGIQVSKRTIQKYMAKAREEAPGGQNWGTFLATHAKDIWACDFIPVITVLFQTLYAFVIVEHASRRVMHIGVTARPTDDWTAEQVRAATPNGDRPAYLICDNDGKYGERFEEMVGMTGIELIHTPYAAPKANAICERFVGSARRECLDHMLIFGEQQLGWVLGGYKEYFNEARPHQGLAQRIPVTVGLPVREVPTAGRIVATPVLNGLHHDYRRIVDGPPDGAVMAGRKV